MSAQEFWKERLYEIGNDCGAGEMGSTRVVPSKGRQLISVSVNNVSQ